MPHAYLVAGPLEAGRDATLDFVVSELDLVRDNNPDVIEIRRSLFTVDDSRELFRIAYQAPMRGDVKALIVIAGRMYHEAQNALLKLFEEPPIDTTLFLVVPMEGIVIGTLRSRLVPLPGYRAESLGISDAAKDFLKKDEKGRSALITKLTSGKDDEEKREARDTALSILDGVESAVYTAWKKGKGDRLLLAELLSEFETLRGNLIDRSSSIKMILEHVAIATPANLA